MGEWGLDCGRLTHTCRCKPVSLRTRLCTHKDMACCRNFLLSGRPAQGGLFYLPLSSMVNFLNMRKGAIFGASIPPYMASFTAYHLRILDARGELVESFPPGLLSELVRLATERVADFDAYQTVYRVLKQTGGLYARPFLAVPPPPAAKGKRKQPAPAGPFIVHVVSAKLYHIEQPA